MYLKYLTAFLILFTAILIAQVDDNPVAKIGNNSISQKEFLERYELTPLVNKQMKDIHKALKKDFLYTLIAEKLFAKDALERNLDTNEIVKYNLNEFKKMFVRDALYRKEILNKSKSLADTLLDYLY